jgi:hypothetical protein
MNKTSCAPVIRAQAIFALFLAIQMLLPLGAFAEVPLPNAAVNSPSEVTPSAPPVPINLNLSDTARSTTAGQITGFQNTSIVVNGITQAVTAMTALTAAESLAVMQVLQSGQQSIMLGITGHAVGGSFSVNAQIGRMLSSLVIPQGVTAIAHFNQSSDLNIIGNLTNAGALYAVATNDAIQNVNMNAQNILNAGGGLITTQLPQDGLTGFSNAVPNLGLTLNAVENIINFGTISSASHLNMQAGGAIVNNANAVMHAVSNLNMTSGAGRIVNNGLVASQLGSINLSTAESNRSFNVNNSAGTFQAVEGQINVGDPQDALKTNLSISGGDWLSEELNLHGGDGKTNVFVDEITGRTNISAGEAHVMVSDGKLHLGDLTLTGDPTFYNDALNGDIEIGGNITVGETLTIVASRHITNTLGFTLTASGFDINVVAGANISTTGTPSPEVGPFGVGGTDTGTPAINPVVVNGPSSTGGNIVFSDATISTQAIGLSNPGGNVRLIAYGDSATGSNGGIIDLGANTTILTGGTGTATNGNVTLLAGSTTSGEVIASGGINTTGGSGGGGAVTLTNAQPVFSTGSSLTFATNGSISSGNDFSAGSFGNGVIAVSNTIISPSTINATSGIDGNIELSANLSGGTSVNLNAQGTGAIGGSGQIAAQNVVLRAGAGIGTEANPVELQDAISLSVIGGGSGDVVLVHSANAGTLNISYAAAGDNLDISSNRPLTVTSAYTLQGSLLLSTSEGALTVAQGGRITAADQLMLQNTDTTNGTIVVSKSAFLAGTGQEQTQVILVIGALPIVPQPGVKPSAVTEKKIGGQIFYNNGITAVTPTNFITANNRDVLFSRDTGTITLGGGVRILASNNPLLNSLDLTDQNVVSLIQAQQATKIIGGTLVGTAGNLSGTVIVSPFNLSAGLSAFNIPSGVTTTFNGFKSTDVVNVDLTTNSSSDTATIGGIVQFSGTGTNAMLRATTNVPLPVITIEPTSGRVTSTGPLSLIGAGDINVLGAVSSTNTNIAAVLNGNVTIGGTAAVGKSGAPLTISTVGTGTITQATGEGKLLGSLLSLKSDTGDIGADGAPLRTLTVQHFFETKGNVFVANSGTTGLNGGSTVGSLSLTSTGTITIKGVITGLDTIALTAAGSMGIKQLASGAVNAPSVDLRSTSGPIGSGSIFIKTDAENLAVNTNGDVWVTSTAPVMLEESSGKLFRFRSTAQNSSQPAITILGDLSATNVDIKNTSASGSIFIQGEINGLVTGNATTAILAAGGTGSVTMPDGLLTPNSISTTTLTLTSLTGNIGSFLLGGGPVRTNATTFSFNTGGDVRVENIQTGIAKLATSRGNSIEVSVPSGTLNVTGKLVGPTSTTGTSVDLTANSVILTSTVTSDDITVTTANGSITQPGGGTKLFAGTIDLTANSLSAFISSNIGTFAVPIGVSNRPGQIAPVELTASTVDNSLFVAVAGSVNLGSLTAETTAKINATKSILIQDAVNAPFITIVAGTTGSITQLPAAILNGISIVLFGGLGIGGPGSAIQINDVDSINLSVFTADDAFINSSTGINFLDSTATKGLTLTASGPIETFGKITSTAGAINLTTNGNGITISNALTAKNVNITSSAGVSISAAVTGSAGVSILAAAGNSLVLAPTAKLTSTGTPIILSADTMDFQENGTVKSSIKAGTGAVTLKPTNTSLDMVFPASDQTPDFDVTASMLTKITAGTVVIGSPDVTGSLSVPDSYAVNASGAGSFNLTLTTGGAFLLEPGHTLSTRTKTFTINAGTGLLSNGVMQGAKISLSTLTGDIGAEANRISINGSSAGATVGLTINAPAGSAFISSIVPIQLLGNSVVSESSVGDSFDLMVAGNITLANGSTVTATTGDIVLFSTTATGNILQSSATALTLLAQNISLASGGSIGTTTLALRTGSSDEFTASAGGSINIANTGDGSLVLHDSTSGGSFKFLNSDSFNVENIQSGTNSPASIAKSTNSIQLIADAGTLTVTDGANIEAFGGNVILQNKNLSTGNILIDDNVDILASSTSTSAGHVTIFIGTTTPAGVNATPPVTGVNPVITNKNGTGAIGAIFYGVNNIVATGSSVNDLNAEGRKIIFSTGTRPASAITLGSVAGNVVITADPPAGMTSMVPLQVTAPSTVSAIQQAAATQTVALPQHDFSSFAPTIAIPQSDLNPSLRNPAMPISAGSTPKVIRQTASVDYENVSVVGGQSTAPSAEGHDTMVVAPAKDVTIPAGPFHVSIGAGAIALVVTHGESVSVFNLHDRTNGDVSIIVGDQKHVVTPGRQATLTQAASNDFADVNTLGTVGHRDLKVNDLGGVKKFTSEFSLISAMRGIKGLARMKNSSNPIEHRIYSQLLKNAAIMMQTRAGAGAYQRFAKRQSYITAQNK